MCSECKSSDIRQPETKSGRLRLWEFNDNAQCSLIGTCLSPDDLLKIARKLALVIEDNSEDHHIHAYFVNRSTEDSAEARAIHKLLDHRYAGMLRKVGRLNSSEDYATFWESMKESGQIAGAFYALLTLRAVPDAFRAHIFGQVHMLSHLLGASYRQKNSEAVRLQNELNELKSRKHRVETGLYATLEEKTGQIEMLEHKLLKQKSLEAHQKSNANLPQNENVKLDKTLAALEASKQRLAEAESEINVLRERTRRLELELASRATQTAHETIANSAPEKETKLNGRSILYLGGQPNLVPHLERHARKCGATLIHHDGGLEESVTRIDAVLPSVDYVICPIDCISHDACLRAKHGCQRFGKLFMPLKTSSRSSFKRALKEIGAMIDDA